MDFSHLDDAQPPQPDATMRAGVVSKAQRRRRTRLAYESGAALVVIVAVVVAVIATRPDGDVRVATQPPAETPGSTVPAPPVTVAPGQIGVTLELDHETVARGDDVTGTVVFVNPSADTVKVTDGHSCVSKFAVVVDTAFPQDVAWTDECASSPGPVGTEQTGVTGSQYLVIPPGTTRVPFRAATQAHACWSMEANGSAPSGSDLHACDKNGQPPLFPIGPAHVYFLSATNAKTTPIVDAPLPAPITITG